MESIAIEEDEISSCAVSDLVASSSSGIETISESSSSVSYILGALPVPSTQMLEDASLTGDGDRGVGSMATGGASGVVAFPLSIPSGKLPKF